MGWFQPVSDAIYKALCAVFGIDPQSNDGLKRFVPAYIHNATNAQPPRETDICYFALSELQGTDFDYFQLKNIVVAGVPKVSIQKTVPINVLFTFYGEHADDDAEFFWSRIMWDSGSGSARSILRKSKIVPMGKPDRPLSLFEEEGTFHRRRCDVRMNFAYLMTSDVASGYVNEAPDLVIDSENN